jgi:hypothetical protein
MNTRVLIAALVALLSLACFSGLSCKDNERDKLESTRKKAYQAIGAAEWSTCRLLLIERGKVAPKHGADYFDPIVFDDIGKSMITTVGPAGVAKETLSKFRNSISSKDRSEAGRIIDDGLVTWLKPGQEVVLEALTQDGVATIRPPGGSKPVYVLFWSVKRAE